MALDGSDSVTALDGICPGTTLDGMNPDAAGTISLDEPLGTTHELTSTTGLISTGIEALDLLLPEPGWRPGTLVEWLEEGEGSGAALLVLRSAARVMRVVEGGALVVIDQRGEFYPPAASDLKIDLNRTIVVRPSTDADALWALEQSLQCPGVAAVLCWLEALHNLVFRRLQLAVEKGGGIGFFIRPASVRPQPSWAEVRLLVQPLPGRGPSSGRRLNLILLRCRGGVSGGAIELEMSHETGDVHLVSQLASATHPECQAGTFL